MKAARYRLLVGDVETILSAHFEEKLGPYWNRMTNWRPLAEQIVDGVFNGPQESP